jgi:hypothetical protein
MNGKGKSRSLRRHHMERLKANRKRYWGRGGQGAPDSMSEKDLGMVVHTAALCSCFMCGNARKYFGKPTLQEEAHTAQQDEELLDLPR